MPQGGTVRERNRFPKTHDLVELIDVLRDDKKSPPPDVESLDGLNPYAVTLRYDLFDVEPSALERDTVLKIVADLRSWAEREVTAFDDTGDPGGESSGDEP